MFDARQPEYLRHVNALIERGFSAIKIPAERVIMPNRRILLNSDKMMQVMRLMEQNDILLSVDLAAGAEQISE